MAKRSADKAGQQEGPGQACEIRRRRRVGISACIAAAVVTVLAAVAAYAWTYPYEIAKSEQVPLGPVRGPAPKPIAGMATPPGPVAAPPASLPARAPEPSRSTAAAASTPGLKVLAIESQWLPPIARERLLMARKNFQETGSASGGRKTHEFARLDYMSMQLQQKGIDTLVAKLAITPSDLARTAGRDFILVGADIAGKLIERRGFTAFFQIVQSDTRMAELSEEQLEPEAGDKRFVDPVFLNYQIAGYPATMEQLRDTDESPLVNLRWQAGDRAFSLTTRNLTLDEATYLASQLSTQALAMPFKGWKVPPDTTARVVPPREPRMPPQWAPSRGAPMGG